MMLEGPYQLRLRFFALDVLFSSDTRAQLDYFEQLYPRFRAEGLPAPGQPVARYALLTGADHNGAGPLLVLDKEVWPLSGAGLSQKTIYDTILADILAKIRTHFLFHASVAASEGQGLIIVGDSFHGKTTLVLELMRHGFKFLSDETAALGRADGQVHPFPRSLRIRRKSLELTGFSPSFIESSLGHERLVLDVEALQADSLGEAAAIHTIIILHNPDAAGLAGQADRPEREIAVRIDRLDGGLAAAVRGLDAVNDLRVAIDDGVPTLRFCTARDMVVLSQIERLCRERRLLIVEIDLRYERPNFRSPARLEAISRSQTVLELLRRFQGGHRSALLCEEFGGSSTRLYLELAALISGANCYRLSVGRLDDMAALVCGLIEPPAGKRGRASLI